VTRPERIVDANVQHERTSLAWERTAVAVMVAGVFLARAGTKVTPALSVPGIALVLAGAFLLVWSGRHYDDLHGRVREGTAVVYPEVARVVGFVAMVGTGTATLIGLSRVISG
jgi:uncharacterized membrane protein YidH (DUF202 family)